MPESNEIKVGSEAAKAIRHEGESATRDSGIPSDDDNVFELIYDGANVADGTMSARELTEVLAGLTRAFSTVAHDRDLGDTYELRVKDIEANSFHLIFEAIAFAKTNPGTTAALAAGTTVVWNAIKDTVSGGYRVIMDIAKAIDTKKKLKGARLSTTPTTFSENEVVLSLPDGTIITLTKEQYELLLARRIDKQISQIVSPLNLNRIDDFRIRRSNEELVVVNVSQKDYFDYQEVTESVVQEGTEISGTFNSLTKSSRRGTFYTNDGVHVPYRYVGGDDAQLLRGFSAREPVRVRGRIKFDSQGVPSSIEVQDIESLQRTFSDQ